jgi:hypothetical protein
MILESLNKNVLSFRGEFRDFKNKRDMKEYSL